MKRFSAALLFVAGLNTGSAIRAQTITVGAPQLNFGTATEVAPQTRTLSVANPTNGPIAVAAQLFTTYGQPAFSVTPSTFTVLAGATQSVTVTFAPLHNIQHNSELVFTTDHLGAVAVDLLGQGQYSIPYYNATQNLREEALLLSLKTITGNGYNSLGYNTARDRMFMTIDNKRVNGQGATVNTAECIYTGRLATGYSNRSGAQGQNFNTEHTWPQSMFNSANPMVSDLHHLFPSDVDANASRSNNGFGVATLPYRNDNINAPSHLGANSRYEPRDPQKGRTARAMIYFVTRYQNYTFFFGPQQAILRQWNRQFPSTQVERNRNTAVLAAQGNRNPFSDYPQFADRITDFIGAPSVGLDSVAVYRSAPTTINFGNIAGPAVYTYVLVNMSTQPLNLTSAVAATSVTGVALTVTPATGTVAPGESVSLAVRLDPGSITGPITGTLTLASTFPAPNNGIVVPISANASPTATPRAIDITAPRLEVYPNPATEELTVVRALPNPAFGVVSVAVVTMFDGLGRVVRTLPATADALTVLDVRGLPAGLYVVRVGELSRRVVIR